MDIFLHFDECQSTASLQKKQRAFRYLTVILLDVTWAQDTFVKIHNGIWITSSRNLDPTQDDIPADRSGYTNAFMHCDGQLTRGLSSPWPLPSRTRGDL